MKNRKKNPAILEIYSPRINKEREINYASPRKGYLKQGFPLLLIVGIAVACCIQYTRVRNENLDIKQKIVKYREQSDNNCKTLANLDERAQKYHQNTNFITEALKRMDSKLKTTQTNQIIRIDSNGVASYSTPAGGMKVTAR